MDLAIIPKEVIAKDVGMNENRHTENDKSYR